MTEQQSPYNAPQSYMSNQPPAGMPMAPQMQREPGAIKTFGVLHLVIAGIGVLTLLYTLVTQLFADKLVQSLSNLPGQSPDATAIQANYMRELHFFTWITSAFSLTLIIMLVMAGLALLKAKDLGRVLSLRYAWTSIAMKVMTIIFTIIWVVPATKRMTEQMYQGMKTVPGNMSSLMSSVAAYSTLISICFTFIYPIIVLVMMRNEKIKNYLAGR